jgi:hypothetical protein
VLAEQRRDLRTEVGRWIDGDRRDGSVDEALGLLIAPLLVEEEVLCPFAWVTMRGPRDEVLETLDDSRRQRRRLRGLHRPAESSAPRAPTRSEEVSEAALGLEEHLRRTDRRLLSVVRSHVSRSGWSTLGQQLHAARSAIGTRLAEATATELLIGTGPCDALVLDVPR